MESDFSRFSELKDICDVEISQESSPTENIHINTPCNLYHQAQGICKHHIIRRLYLQVFFRDSCCRKHIQLQHHQPCF